MKLSNRPENVTLIGKKWKVEEWENLKTFNFLSWRITRILESSKEIIKWLLSLILASEILYHVQEFLPLIPFCVLAHQDQLTGTKKDLGMRGTVGDTPDTRPGEAIEAGAEVIIDILKMKSTVILWSAWNNGN